MLKHFQSACLAALLLAAPVFAEVKVGDRPAIDWKTTEGQSVTNADLKGRIIVVDFWATWCAPCMAEAEHMVKLRKQYADKGVNLLGISLDSNVGRMKQVTVEKGFDWPQVCDTLGWNGEIPRAWGVRGIPQTFILSGEGEVVWAGHPAEIDGALEKAVGSIKAPDDPRKEILKSIDEAGLKLADKDYASVAAALAKLPDAAWKDPETRLALRTLAVKALRPGEGAEKFRAAAAKERGLEAKLDALAPGSRSTPAATRPSDSADKSAQAKAQLAKADKTREEGDHVQAYGLYRRIAKSFAGTPEATAAAEQVAKYEKDPAVMQAVKDEEKAKAARSQLALAKGYREGGKIALARETYLGIIKDYPGTPAAKEAEAGLADVKK
ncbi:MAG: TlpA disulfide reductase family protein [Planctomycetota bacterium]|nr:TlpA disulfide reductase family protein [Planctomycetota bacterium]